MARKLNAPLAFAQGLAPLGVTAGDVVLFAGEDGYLHSMGTDEVDRVLGGAAEVDETSIWMIVGA